jgi:hypothetical protein
MRVLDRVNLLTAIGQVDLAGVPEAVAGLRDYINGRGEWGQTVALGGLRRLGPAAREAVPDLIRLVRASGSRGVRPAVIQTLGEIGRGSREAESALREWAAENNPAIKPEVEEALKKVTAKPDSK